MPSFNAVNYSLRPSKSIQRQLVFDAVRHLQSRLDLEGMAYVGFGSVWFTDFLMAHKQLGTGEMASIESDNVGFARAVYNAPFAAVRVFHGVSSDVLPQLYKDERLNNRPWMIWLDFDYEFNESVADDLRSIIENAPENSILLTTFNGLESKYARKAPERPEVLKQLFGPLVPDNLSKADCMDERMHETLASFALAFMRSHADEVRRPGGFVPAFRIIYRDGAPMITVGGILPAKGAKPIAEQIAREPEWACQPEVPIVAPHLTIREAAALQALLPRSDALTRELVRSLGFDLDDAQIAAFARYYKQYPAYAQIVA